MTRICILYDSIDGQTEKIACHMADVLREASFEVTLNRVRSMPDDFSFADFEGVIVGGSIHGSHHSRQLNGFVSRNLGSLSETPSFFFSVSLSAAGKTQRQQQNAERCLAEFIDGTHWRPLRSATFAGALRYREYNPVLRWIMKRIAASEGGDTDTSRDYEYTDWQQVASFAVACAQDAQARSRSHSS